jgi:hypothetical protein
MGETARGLQGPRLQDPGWLKDYGRLLFHSLRGRADGIQAGAAHRGTDLRDGYRTDVNVQIERRCPYDGNGRERTP